MPETRPLAGPVLAGSVFRRFGRSSSLRVKPARLLKSRSMFQIRSPISVRFSRVNSSPQAAATWGARSAVVHAKVVNTQMPAESNAAVASWKALTSSGLPSVTSGSVLTGMPSTSEATVYERRWQAPRFEVA